MRKTRTLAIQHKEPWYYTGKPCKHGHISKRSTIDGSCSACRAVNVKAERVSIRERLKSA